MGTVGQTVASEIFAITHVSLISNLAETFGVIFIEDEIRRRKLRYGDFR